VRSKIYLQFNPLNYVIILLVIVVFMKNVNSLYNVYMVRDIKDVLADYSFHGFCDSYMVFVTVMLIICSFYKDLSGESHCALFDMFMYCCYM